MNYVLTGNHFGRVRACLFIPKDFSFSIGVLSLLLSISILAGCSGPRLKEYPRHESYAIQGYADTTLGNNFSALEKKNPDKSGYFLLSEGDQAFAARLSMVDMADKTIDIQYYIYRFDIAGKMLAKKLLDAADY